MAKVIINSIVWDQQNFSEACKKISETLQSIFNHTCLWYKSISPERPHFFQLKTPFAWYSWREMDALLCGPSDNTYINNSYPLARLSTILFFEICLTSKLLRVWVPRMLYAVVIHHRTNRRGTSTGDWNYNGSREKATPQTTTVTGLFPTVLCKNTLISNQQE